MRPGNISCFVIDLSDEQSSLILINCSKPKTPSFSLNRNLSFNIFLTDTVEFVDANYAGITLIYVALP
jgi:hypothetical protein